MDTDLYQKRQAALHAPPYGLMVNPSLVKHNELLEKAQLIAVQLQILKSTGPQVRIPADVPANHASAFLLDAAAAAVLGERKMVVEKLEIASDKLLTEAAKWLLKSHRTNYVQVGEIEAELPDGKIVFLEDAQNV